MLDICKAKQENGHPFCTHFNGNLSSRLGFFFFPSAYLEFYRRKIASYGLGSKTLFPLLCCKVIKGPFVLTLCGSLKRRAFIFLVMEVVPSETTHIPKNNPMWNLLISDTYFPQKHSHSEREIAFHKRN